MARNVADALWEMLSAAGVKRCYGIVGDALNPVIDALRRNGSVDFLAEITSDTVPVAGVVAGTGVTAGGRKFRNTPQGDIRQA